MIPEQVDTEECESFHLPRLTRMSAHQVRQRRRRWFLAIPMMHPAHQLEVCRMDDEPEVVGVTRDRTMSRPTQDYFARPPLSLTSFSGSSGLFGSHGSTCKGPRRLISSDVLRPRFFAEGKSLTCREIYWGCTKWD